MTQILKIDNLVVEGMDEYGWKPIVNGIDLTLNRGEVLGLIGESGAGKSTIGLAAMAYTRSGCRIVDGSVFFDGRDLLSTPEEFRRKIRGSRIAYVAQSAAAAFNPAHRLIDQFAEGPIQHGIMKLDEAREKAISLYKVMDLPDPDTIGFRYPHQVSGGQLQRAMVAMAMACRPEIIVFDEPTSALDVTTQIEVLAAIKEIINQQNTAAIYITHDLAVVAQLADRIMVLRHGDLVEQGTAKEILDNPQKEYTRRLLSVRSQRDDEAGGDLEAPVVMKIEGLSAGYTKEVNVVKDIDLKICRGRTVAIVGESGSGKTSLARAVTGLLSPKKGRILFNGQELPPRLKDRTRDSLRRLQMIYQMPDVALNPRQKIRKILGRPLEFYFNITGPKKEERTRDLLEMIELPSNYIERFPSELSGGEKQRLCIARALAAEPDLIICDEVTSALDQIVAEDILTLLLRLQKELGVSYLYITHDLATVKAISHEIVVMLEGSIVEQGVKDEVLRPPYHPYTELLLSSVPEMDPAWLDNLLLEREAGNQVE